ncbi:hypothetical protein KZG41_000034 [Campylobacter upsaliensis]|nr:hypothetical protein [Campylobacter upsaliensis]
MAKSKRGFSFELRNSRQNRALGVASLRANLAKCGAFRWVCAFRFEKFKAKRDGLGFSFESCRGELGAFA